MKKKESVAIEFAEELSKREFQTIVLKGLAYASYYPNPYHRESGDLDCYLMGKKDEGDKITVEIGGKMEEAGYKHSHLFYKGLKSKIIAISLVLIIQNEVSIQNNYFNAVY